MRPALGIVLTATFVLGIVHRNNTTIGANSTAFVDSGRQLIPPNFLQGCDEKDAATKGPDDYEAIRVKSHVYFLSLFSPYFQVLPAAGQTQDHKGEHMRFRRVADKTADKITTERTARPSAISSADGILRYLPKPAESGTPAVTRLPFWLGGLAAAPTLSAYLQDREAIPPSSSASAFHNLCAHTQVLGVDSHVSPLIDDLYQPRGIVNGRSSQHFAGRDSGNKHSPRRAFHADYRGLEAVQDHW
jgi:hypothetical protein